MSPTCAKKPMQSKPLLAALTVIASLVMVAPVHAAKKAQGPVPAAAKNFDAYELAESGVVAVSDYEYNTFVFSEPVKRVFFPPGTPVAGEPISLADGTRVMVTFNKGANAPIQMIAELVSKRVEQVRLKPQAIPGVTFPVGSAKLKQAPAKPAAAQVADASGGATPRGADIELLKTLTTTGEPPSGFDPVNLPKTTRFDKFASVPLAGWSDGAKRIFVFSLVAAPDQTAVVSPNQFYRQGITAVLLDGDTVDANSSPQLFVVEELNDE